ncbi:MAG: hypothetical protein COU81_03195 [Candidatus Portnoybacteria bacterium CG10_big_fil_rev_8_21_14_0_10_36_7]|uniref:Uncharacterized protein n=1 Tax=Candidatus Portnoybacteria bacterium CG10_big_fil_rev_8_21_14_0_10_36_7 TaxID=1974812 RepID=A0A2M8KDK5_9BACT|nr:MAG: hypothetical protein COU81_03195 [Candidatus Portnoybacteria bacterium CG10_big_fil_rev_8_21_14_0_10_36_7]
MPNEQIIQYIKSAKQEGLADQQIKEALQKANWLEAEIDIVMQSANNIQQPINTSVSTKQPLKRALQLIRESINIFKQIVWKVALIELTPIILAAPLILVLIARSINLAGINQTNYVTESTPWFIIILLIIYIPLIAIFSFSSLVATLFIIKERANLKEGV